MSTHAEKAKTLFLEGYNCSQSVLAAFCDTIEMEFETALLLSSSFGGGMGRLREVCGAVSSMFMIAGLKYGYTSPTDHTKKAEHYALIQLLAERFKATNGSIICRELLGLDHADGSVPEKRTDAYYKIRPCAELVYEAAEIMDAYIEERKK